MPQLCGRLATGATVFEKRAHVLVLLRDAPPAAGAQGHCAASHIWLELNFGSGSCCSDGALPFLE
jgi:hypothetical protein